MFPSLGDLPDPGIEPQVSCIADRLFPVWATREAQEIFTWTRAVKIFAPVFSFKSIIIYAVTFRSGSILSKFLCMVWSKGLIRNFLFFFFTIVEAW